MFSNKHAFFVTERNHFISFPCLIMFCLFNLKVMTRKAPVMQCFNAEVCELFTVTVTLSLFEPNLSFI